MSIFCSKCGKSIFVLARYEDVLVDGKLQVTAFCDKCYTENWIAKHKISKERARHLIQEVSTDFYDYEDEQAFAMALAAMDQQSATLALLHDLRRYLHDSTGSSLELDTRREALHGMVVDRIRELEDKEAQP